MPDRGTSTGLRAPSPLRLSTVRDCPLRAIYAATGAPERELYEKERRILWSGRRIGTDYLDMLEAGGVGPIEREVKIPWDFGVGHADGWIAETGTILEILSSAHASDDMVRSKLLQLVLYMHYKPDALNGALLIVNPRDYSEDRVIVVKGTDKYDQLLVDALDRVEQVRVWNDTGRLPERVCSKPSEAMGHFCRHAEHCFTDWTPAPLDQVDTPEARQAALAFAQAKQNEKAAEALYESAKERRVEIQARLLEHVPVGKTAVGPFEVHRIHYAGRSTFKLTLAEQDSRIPSDLLAEFTKVGAPYDVVKIERVSNDPALDADGFGDEVPWTDADLVTP